MHGQNTSITIMNISRGCRAGLFFIPGSTLITKSCRKVHSSNERHAGPFVTRVAERFLSGPAVNVIPTTVTVQSCVSLRQNKKMSIYDVRNVFLLEPDFGLERRSI